MWNQYIPHTGCGTNVPPRRTNTKKDIAFIKIQYSILGHKVIIKKIQLCEQKCTELGKKSKDDRPLKGNSKIFCFNNVICN